MKPHRLSPRDHAKAVGIGIANALLLTLVMLPTIRLGMAPLPKPPSQAFAQLLLGPVPLPVGLLFHIAYVAFWSWLFVVMFRDTLSFGQALGLGIALWIVILVVFFPLIGWGWMGLGIGPMVPLAALVPHLLFSLFLWALAGVAFKPLPRHVSAS